MNPRTIGIAFLLVVAPAHSQEQPLVQRFRIASELTTVATRSTLVDGEERAFGGGGGGRGGGPSIPSGPSETSSRAVVGFEESNAPHAPRRYLELHADETRAGRDGLPQESRVEGALTGRAVVRAVDDQGQVLLVELDGDQRRELAAELATGVPARVDLAPLVPKADQKDGAEYALDSPARAALRGLFHPVTSDRRGGGFGGPGGRGRGSRGRPGGAGIAEWIALLESEAMKLEGKATLAGVVEVDGRSIARVRIELALRGADTPARLGIAGPGGTGGFGSRGAFPGENAGEAKAEATLTLTGEIQVDRAARRVIAVDLKGKLESESSTKLEVERDGKKSVFQTRATSTGTLALRATVATVD